MMFARAGRSSTRYLTRVIVVILAAGASMVTGCEKELTPSFQEGQPGWRNVHGPLLRTHWGQEAPYSALSPGQEALGCWSVAFAQTLAYHRLQPKGQVSYKTRGGRSINENLDRPVDWDHITSSIGPEASGEDSLQTALYCYQSSVVVQKDFGRGEYMDIAAVPREVSEHYGCKVERVDAELLRRVKTELLSDRPVIAYFDDILDINIVRNGHAAVIDGYAEDGKQVFTHINFGWNSASDGWYEFSGLAHDRDLQYIFTVEP